MFNSLIHFEIPDFIFLILIVAFLIWLFLNNKRFKERIDEDIEEIYSELREINEELRPKRIKKEVEAEPEEEERLPKEEEKIELNEEHIFVLSTIADEPENMYQQEDLFDLYKVDFSEKGREDFDSIIKELETLNFIKSGATSDYKAWLEITEKALEYLENKGKNEGE